MTDIIDLATYRSDRRIEAFAVPAPRFRVGDKVQDTRREDRAGTVTQHLGYSQRRSTHCYTVRTQILTFVGYETELVELTEAPERLTGDAG